MSKIETPQISKPKLPKEVVDYIKRRSANPKGRPHLLQILAEQIPPRNPISVTLNILERSWIKNQAATQIARAYKTTRYTIIRMLNDLFPFQEAIVKYIHKSPKTKVFFNRKLETSDYETVTRYIAQAKRDELRAWKNNLTTARKVWIALGRKDPAKWQAQEVVDHLASLSAGSRSTTLDAIRRVAPQLKDEVRTGRYRELLRRRKKDIFGKEFNMIRAALTDLKMTHHQLVLELHVTLGAREGATNPKSGMVGIRWDMFKKNFTKMDLWESKVRGGILWQDCPIDLFFAKLPAQIRALWEERGKPMNEKLLKEGYKELRRIYKEIREVLAVYFAEKLEPSLFKEITTLKPHDADKIHVNLLWEAEVPLEVVAGQDLGRGEGIGLMGRGWLSIDTIKKYYLSLTQRSERFQKLRKKVTEYSHRFNGEK